MIKTITISLDEETLNKLDEAARKENRSRSRQISYIISKYIEKGAE